MSIQSRTAAVRPLARAWEWLAPMFFLALDWTVERFPIVGRASVRKRRQVVLAPYQRMHTLRGSLLQLIAIPLVVVGCLVYGFFFGLTVPWLMVPFAVPIAVLTALIIWALPDQRTAPTAPIEFLLASHFVILILWPRYLAITFPGMPWITFLRLVGLPMAGLFLISLSVSSAFRHRLSESVTSVKTVWYFFLGFLVIQALTSVVSSSPIASTQLTFDQQIYWTCTFLLSCMVFRKIDLVEKYWALWCILGVFIVAITAIEFKEQHVIWASHIPGFLRIPDPSVQLTLTPQFRPGIHVYRAKATFATALGLAEYLSLLTPFLLHFGFSSRNLLVKAGCFLMIPAIFMAIRMTDARLGLVGMVVSLLLFGVLWTIVRWRSRPHDLIAAASVYAYPVLFMGGVGALLASHRAKLMLLGDGAQASSTEARQTQLGMALSKVATHPWGFGSGQAGNAMGFAKGAFITVDNYFITLIMDYGILGVIFWYGCFISGIVVAVRYCISAEHGNRPEAKLLAPLAVGLSAFLIIKWVHGQSDNHSIYFMMLGMICALVYRIKHTPPQADPDATAFHESWERSDREATRVREFAYTP